MVTSHTSDARHPPQDRRHGPPHRPCPVGHPLRGRLPYPRAFNLNDVVIDFHYLMSICSIFMCPLPLASKVPPPRRRSATFPPAPMNHRDEGMTGSVVCFSLPYCRRNVPLQARFYAIILRWLLPSLQTCCQWNVTSFWHSANTWRLYLSNWAVSLSTPGTCLPMSHCPQQGLHGPNDAWYSEFAKRW